MQTFLICGGREKERLVCALEKGGEVSREDLIILEPTEKASLGIGEVRQLEHQLNLKPYRSSHKVGLVRKAETLTVEAQNALLKTLEEPPERTQLILTASTPEELLPTIVSRCQVIQLPPKTEVHLEEDEILPLLSSIFHLLSFGLGQRLALVPKIAPNRQEALEFLDKQTIAWRKILLDSLQTRPENGLSPRELLRIIRHLRHTKTMIGANVNPRLALEIFFLDLPALEG